MNSEKTYRVVGMTCEHCERAVSEEVQKLPGVRSARADHLAGELAVGGDGIEDTAVRVAVEAAGYELAVD